MWANTALKARIFIISAHAFIPFLIFMIHWSWLTFFIAVAGVIFFTVLEYYGYTPPVFARVIKLYLGGSRRRSQKSTVYNALNKY